MWYSLFAYIKFLLRSTNQHGVHSPFVFKLITQCFYNKKVFNDYSKLKNYRQKLIKNNSRLSVTDLGSGSKKRITNQRLISEIAKTSGSTKKRTQLLYRLSNYFQFNTILELGTSLGIATQAIHLGNSNSKVITIEGCPNISAFTLEQLQDYLNIEIINGNIKEEVLKLNIESFDMIFFDGNHTKKATLEYFELLLPTVHNDTLFIFDDIYWSKDMTEAWKAIKNHPKVTITIDTYFWGFVFFRKEQKKEHFTIRM